MSRESYIVALKREKRSSAPADWQERLRDVEGLRELGGNDRRLQIEASEEAIEKVRERLASLCHIEKMIPHERL